MADSPSSWHIFLEHSCVHNRMPLFSRGCLLPRAERTDVQWLWAMCGWVLLEVVSSLTEACESQHHMTGCRRRWPHFIQCYSIVYIHPFNGPLSGTTLVSQYQKGKTNLDFTEARDSEWQWHPLGHMQVSTSLQTDNHASTPPLSFFTGRMPFLPPNQQSQSTEGNTTQ